ncbi:hypothetical protein BH10ACI2_BH10ACI2_22480 [soil metagenome]
MDTIFLTGQFDRINQVDRFCGGTQMGGRSGQTDENNLWHLARKKGTAEAESLIPIVIEIVGPEAVPLR